MKGDKKIESQDAEEQYDCLAKYGQDLLKLASEGKFDPVIGRDDEIRRVIQVNRKVFIHSKMTLNWVLSRVLVPFLVPRLVKFSNCLLLRVALSLALISHLLNPLLHHLVSLPPC